MKFLTKVPQHELRRRANWKGRESADDRHRDVMSLFGDLPGNPREQAQILFRFERLPGQAPTYLIRSDIRPSNPTPQTLTKTEPEMRLEKGMVVAFRISINAIQRKSTGGIRPVPYDVPSDLDLDEDDFQSASELPQVSMTPWLAQKLAPALADVTVLNHHREVLGGRRSGGSSGKVIQVDTVDGIAVVGDVEALRALLAKGVGRAKAYGCGLLTIRPL